MSDLPVLEICAGAGGQALGLEASGFAHVGAVEVAPTACATLRLNRPSWNVIEDDIRRIDGRDYRGVALLAGGVPCPPFSIAGRQLGATDDRDLFPEALRLVREARPCAVLLENVRGLASARFSSYRQALLIRLNKLGYEVSWQILNASEQGLPQLRPRFVLVGLKRGYAAGFSWPEPVGSPPSVGAVLRDLMAERGWPGAFRWAAEANGIGPTLVGGSQKHGGPDLGPTRARAEWRRLSVDGIGLADRPPAPDFPIDASPKLTLRMVARLQGFPDSWQFAGKKTAAYRQVGNAFPPPVAAAVGARIACALVGASLRTDGGAPAQLALRFSTAV